jgi:hypothetical protein
MEPIVHKSTNFEDAELWDIEQQTRMTPEERQRVAEELKERFYGKDRPDVRESHNRQ